MKRHIILESSGNVQMVYNRSVFHSVSKLLFVPTNTCILGAVMVVIVWLLYLQQPMQSVPINTKVVNSNPTHGEVYLFISKSLLYNVLENTY
jgi:hypothetical protein